MLVGKEKENHTPPRNRGRESLGMCQQATNIVHFVMKETLQSKNLP